MSIIRQNYGTLESDVQTQQIIAPLISTLTATRNWSVGEEFIYNSILYKVTSAISSGSQIVLGSGGNADTASTISEEAYRTNDTAETDIADVDYFPFFDVSANGKKKSLWSNIKTKLKAYFDTLYLAKVTLATVATTGAYSDLTGTPTIPTVNNATLTIQRNGTTLKTFTANASSNVTANISVPIYTTAKVSIATSAISANSVKDFTASVAKTGYTPVGILAVEINAGGNYVTLVNFLISGTTGKVRLCNTSSSAFTPNSVDITVLYLQN